MMLTCGISWHTVVGVCLYGHEAIAMITVIERPPRKAHQITGILRWLEERGLHVRQLIQNARPLTTQRINMMQDEVKMK